MTSIDPTTLRVAQIISPTEAEGPGARMAIWVQGCPLRCPGCCNLTMLPEAGGEVRSVASVLATMTDQRAQLEGVTFLGGEPFAQPGALAAVATAAHQLDLSVMVFSGFRRAELEADPDPWVASLLAACDLLVDGPYERDKPDEVRRWIGSRNQVMHFLSDRYQPSDPRFVGADTFEIRYAKDGLTVNGWPASADHVTSLLRKSQKRGQGRDA